MRAFRSIVWLSLLATVLAGGCSHTNLTNLYKDPSFPSSPLDNLLVIAVERDPDLRRMWEQAIAAQFQSRGVLATPSYQAFPTSLPDSQQVRVVVHRDGMNGAVVSHRLASTTGDFGGGYDKQSTMSQHDYWRGWYHSYYQTAVMGPIEEQKKGRYQLDVWSARDGGKFVWTGTTTEVDPKSVDQLRQEVCGQLVPELERRGVIPKQ
jgi:hypothetical protein